MTTETSYLPAPEQLYLVKMSDMEVAHMIERHIDFVDKNARSVQLPMNFVRSYMEYADKKLPVVVAVSQLPIVLADGRILAMENGLDRDRGIIFRVPKELMRVLPRREDCTPAAVKQAFDFLMNEWLVDVAADFTGKCGLIAASLTLIERSLLPDRPTFFVSAGRRGGGKTTTLRMLVMAVLGMQASAAAWSSNEEERRSAASDWPRPIRPLPVAPTRPAAIAVAPSITKRRRLCMIGIGESPLFRKLDHDPLRERMGESVRGIPLRGVVIIAR